MVRDSCRLAGLKMAEDDNIVVAAGADVAAAEVARNEAAL